jgi:hypothetical protein
MIEKYDKREEEAKRRFLFNGVMAPSGGHASAELGTSGLREFLLQLPQTQPLYSGAT